MSNQAVAEEEVRAAAYRVFCRVGFRAASINDVAVELGRTRPVVYKFATGKEELFRLVTKGVLTRTLAEAEAVARTGNAAERATGVLTAKLDMAVRLHADSPHHAAAFLNDSASLIGDLAADFTDRIDGLVRQALERELDRATARESASILTALTRGLEDDLRAPEEARRLLAAAVETFLRGAARRAPRSSRSTPHSNKEKP